MASGLVNPIGGALPAVSKMINQVAAQTITVRTATVVSDLIAAEATQVVLDNDPSRTIVVAQSVCGPLPQGVRVSCLAYPPRGMVIMGPLASPTGLGTVAEEIAELQADVAALQAASADTGWLNVASTVGFNSTWTQYAGWATAAYRKIGNQVFLKGLVRSGPVGSVIFTLPVGFRPPELTMFTGVCDTRTIGVGGAGDTGASDPNLTSNSGSGNTGGASTGTAHTHNRGSHEHGLQNHTHPSGGGNGSILNIGMRFDIDTSGNVVSASSSSTGYNSIWFTFLTN